MKELNNKFGIAILNFWYTANFGAILTAYALQELIKSLGYTVKVVNNCTDYYLEKQSYYNGFEKKFLNLTELCIDKLDYEFLNNNFDTFIVGSDQVFRPEYRLNDYMRFFLDFACFNKKKIAFSASFGHEDINFEKEMFDNIKKALKTFDYISTREISGKDICKKHFDIDCDWTLDPVFLINKEKFYNLAKESDRDFSNKIISYVLDSNDEYEKLYSKISHKYQKEIYKLFIEKDDILDFIKAFSQSEFIITDSFHGVCFAIIFNKPFACITNKERGFARFNSLIQTFDIKNCFYENIETCLNEFENFETPDYEIINNRIKILSNFAVEKLDLALKSEKNVNYKLVTDAIVKLEKELFELKKEHEVLKQKFNLNEKYIKIIRLLMGFYNI